MPNSQGHPVPGEAVRMHGQPLGYVKQFMREKPGGFVIELQQPRTQEFVTITKNFDTIDGCWQEQFAGMVVPTDASVTNQLEREGQIPRSILQERTPWRLHWPSYLIGAVTAFLIVIVLEWLARG